MKNSFLLIIILICLAWKTNAQEVSLTYNAPHSGRSIVLGYVLNYEKSDIGFGLRYNINTFAHPDDQMNLFRKRQYAAEPMQHIGVQMFYHRFIWSKLFAFYDNQISYTQTFNRIYSPYMYDPYAEKPYTHDDALYKLRLEYFGPFFWIEQNVGIGLKLDITKDIFLTSKIGAGVILIFGKEEQIAATMVQKFQREVSTMMSMGISYKF